jgi:hypothetical protein
MTLIKKSMNQRGFSIRFMNEIIEVITGIHYYFFPPWETVNAYKYQRSPEKTSENLVKLSF